MGEKDKKEIMNKIDSISKKMLEQKGVLKEFKELSDMLGIGREIELEKLRMEHELKRILFDIQLQKLKMTNESSFIAEIQKGGRIAIPKPYRIYHDLTEGQVIAVRITKTTKTHAEA